MRRRHLADYGVLSVVWGCSFAALQRAVQGFGWAGAASFRALLAGLILLAIAAATRRKLNFGPNWRPFAVVGATTVAGQMVGMSFAVPRIGTAMAAIFVGAMPLFTMLIARLWGLEQITSLGQVGLVLGFGGIVLLVGFPAVPVTGSFLLGCATALAGSVSAAFGSNYARRRLAGTGSYEVTTGSFLFGGLMALPLLVFVPVPGLPSVSDFGYLLTLAALMSALAYVLFFRLVAELGATRAMSVEFFVTAIAVTIGSVIQHERLSVPQIVGAAVIIAGCALVLGLIPTLRRRRQLGRPDEPTRSARSARSAPVAQDP
ncbi:MAG TPA: DMT family transporter [Streptosporangiaceae bacterium]|nr:DMT family transporter [Streptosporangiaceae bacterium]